MDLIVAISALISNLFLLLVVEPLPIDHVLELVGGWGGQIDCNLEDALLVAHHCQLLTVPLVERASQEDALTSVDPPEHLFDY